MPLAIPKILVVADPSEQRELVSQLRGAGAPFTEAVIAAGDGDDSTLGQFTALRPQVVVVTATLAAGDTRSLVGAIREAAAKGVFIVLLGDEKGPVRNALDAIDFGCDRFVARPLSVKALRFAVMSGIGTSTGSTSPGAGRADGAGRAAMVSASHVASGAASFQPVDALRTTEPMPVAVRVTAEMPAVWGTDADLESNGETSDASSAGGAERASSPAIIARVTSPMAAARVTAPMRVPTAPLAQQRARWEALADRLGTDEGLGDDDDLDIAVIAGRLPTGEIETGTERAGEPPARHGTHLPEPMTYDDEIALSDEEVDDLSVDEPADPGSGDGGDDDDNLPDGDSEVIELPQAWRTGVARGERAEDAADEAAEADDRTPPPPASPWSPGSTDVPVAPLREPTLVLSDPVAPAPAPAATPASPPGPVEVHLDERQGDSHDQPGGWGASSAVPPAEDEEDVLSDVADGVDEDLSIDLTRQPAAPAPELAAEAAAPPTGGDFARELRRKMSAMAERLFRGADLPAAPVAIGPGHDHHTEIDLRGLVDDPAITGGAEPYGLVGGGATFVGDEELVTNAQPTETRGTAEAGDIQRGVSDAAALIARMFSSDFTGRIIFRRGTTEMVIHVESGRPVFASSNLSHDRMGELLLREGKITAEQLARCRDLVRDTGRRMGEILVERGFLKRRELLPAVRRHVEDIIYSLFAWDQGEYRIVAGDGAAGERIRLSRHPAAMVLEGVRRKLDRATLERLLGPPTAVVEAGDRDKVAAIIGVADLSAEERAALAAFDGSADLAHVARTTGADLLNVYQLAWGLHLLGLVTTRRRVGDDDGDAPALVGESDLAIDRERVRARHALVLDADYFALLGVRRDASGFEIKRAYEAARRDFAADTFPAELRKELAAELDDIAQVLDEAYRVLRDDSLRSKYVAHLRDFGEVAS